MEKTGLKGSIKVFPVDYNPIDINDIIDIHRHLMKKTYIKCLHLLKNVSCIIN